MNVLIVDDDLFSIEAMKKGIRWSELGITEVYSSVSTNEARYIITNNQIDIMICDIEMPNENGFRLVEWVLENDKFVITIFYSCHADFIYAQKAVQLKAFDYILKPSPYKDIETVIQRAVEKRRDDILKIKDTVSQTKRETAMREKFFLGIIDGTIPNIEKEIERISKLNNININLKGKITLILHDINYWDIILKKWNKIDVEFSIKNIGREVLKNENANYISIFPYLSKYYISVIESDNLLEEVELVRMQCKQLNLYFSKLVGKGMNSYVYVNGTLEELSSIVKYLVIVAKNEHQEENLVRIVQEMTLQENEDYDFDFNISKCYKYLVIEDREMLQKSLNEIFETMKTNSQINYFNLEKLCNKYTQMIFSILEIKNINTKGLLMDKQFQELKQKALWGAGSLREFLEYLNNWIIQRLREINNEDYLIDQIKHYINTNLDQAISREDLTKVVFLNPDYMSRLFKKETGVSLSQYITNAKISKAKELLSIPGVSVTMAAEETGYTNFPYFSKIFKRETGYSPTDYKKYIESEKGQ